MPTSTSKAKKTAAKVAPVATSAAIKAAIIAQARFEGFASIGIAGPSDPALRKSAAHLQEFLATGQHGDMAWLAEPVRLARRLDPKALWPETQSIIMLAMSYGPEDDPLAGLQRRTP